MKRKPQTRLKDTATTGAALTAFLLDCEARRLSPRTLGFYRQELEPFLAWLAARGVKLLGGIDAPAIRAYLVALQDRGLRPVSQHAAARSIRAWLNFCVREELLDLSPMRNVQMPKRGSEILPAFTREDVDAMLRACQDSAYPERDAALVLVMLDSGLRAAELLALDWPDVNLTTGAVMVRAGKGAKDRTVFMGAHTRKAVVKYRMTLTDAHPSGAVFVTLDSGTRLKYAGLKQLLRRLGQRAGVSHCTPHTFRRTFALESLRAGMNLVTLAAIMGHADLAMLRRYLALVEHDLADAHAQHGAVDAMLGKKK